jgi:hypothetical protein
MMRTLADCAAPFRAWIGGLASMHRKPLDLVYHWWQEYTKTCTAYDQSPVMSEFECWYAEQLTGPAEVSHAV